MIKRFLKGALVIIFMLFVTTGFSQSDYFAIWTDYNHFNTINKKWSLLSDYGYRVRLNYKDNWQRLHARSSFIYTTKPVRYLAGMAVFLVYLPGEVADFELRPWQGVKYSWPSFDRWRLNHFVRLEERIHFFESSGSNLGYNYFELKFRYLVTLKYNLSKPGKKDHKWLALVGFEPFLNVYVNDTPLSVAKSRTTVGVSYAPTPKTRFRLTYVYQPNNIPLVQGRGVYSNVIRVSVIQKFKSKTDKD